MVSRAYLCPWQPSKQPPPVSSFAGKPYHRHRVPSYPSWGPNIRVSVLILIQVSIGCNNDLKRLELSALSRRHCSVIGSSSRCKNANVQCGSSVCEKRGVLGCPKMATLTRTPATPLSVCPEIFDFYPSGAHEFWVLGGANRTYLIRRPEHIIVLFRSLFKSGAFCNKKRILSQC